MKAELIEFAGGLDMREKSPTPRLLESGTESLQKAFAEMGETLRSRFLGVLLVCTEWD